MRVVLGVDAAWTLTQPSGVALAVDDGSGWALHVVAASYQHFLAHADSSIIPEEKTSGRVLDVPSLLAAAEKTAGAPVDLVAVDMPLSHEPIIGRRVSDTAISKAYGGRHASTHSPSEFRPGPVSDRMREAFSRSGYCLCTTQIKTPGLIEVYPHPALIELARAEKRLPYKLSRSLKYWPGTSPNERRANLRVEWEKIVTLLDGEIAGVSSRLPAPPPEARGATLKAYEDCINAVVCAHVAIAALQGRAMAYGVWRRGFGNLGARVTRRYI